MKKEIMISIEGKQKADGQSLQPIELLTEGTYYLKNGTHYISYKESDLTGFSGCTTTLKIKDEIVSMTRFGDSNTHFEFVRGRNFTTHYDTPYGSFSVDVLPDKVDVALEESEGSVALAYSLELGGNVSYNEFNIHYKEKEN